MLNSRRLQALSAGASVLAITLAAIGMMAVATTPALAACDATAPASGDTVTCDTTLPNPETDGIIAPVSDNVNVIINPGATLETPAGPAVSLGIRTEIDNQGTIRTTGANAAAVVLNMGFGDINPDSSVDNANGFSVGISGSGLIETTGDGSAGVFAASEGLDDVAVFVEMEGIDIATGGADAAGIHVGMGDEGSAIEVELRHLDIQTQGDNSGGFYMPGAAGTASVTSIEADAVTIATEGANATAFYAGGLTGADSVLSFSMTNSNLSTEGDNSGGMIFENLITNGNSIVVVNASDTTVSTLGANSQGFMWGTTDTPSNANNSSRTHAANNVDVTTVGDGSIGFAVYGFGDGADDSDTTTYVSRSEISTQGDDAQGMIIDVYGDEVDNSVITTAMEIITIATVGDRSTGLIVGDGEGPNTGIDSATFTTTLANISIETEGVDAIGFILEPVGVAGTGSAFATDIANITVGTEGLRAHGIVLGQGLGLDVPLLGSTSTFTAENINVTTTGAEAAALYLSGNIEFTPVTSSFAASGANAHGIWGELVANSTTGIVIGNGSSVAATGTGGSGMVFESAGTGAAASVTVETGGTVSGAETGIIFDNVDGTVTVAGTITGSGGTAVQFGDTDDRFELQAGGTVAGTIEGDLGADNFVFSGSGAASFNAAQINDFEDFLKTGNSVWTLTGANAATAPFLVAEGTLVNNAVLQNMAMTVASGARLEGAGTVGGLVVNGTVAPGNSIGTTTVTGNVVFNAGSTYEVEIEAPDQTDLISAAGTATINGGELAITALGTGTSYADGQTYRIVEAGSGVIHNADFTHNQPMSLIRTEVIYGADFVDLLLTADVPFTTFAQTFNQFGATTGLQDLEQTGDALTVYNEIVQLSLTPGGGDAVRRAFDLSSGEIHASGQHVIDQTFSLFSHTLRQQGAAGLGGGITGGQVYTAPLGYSATPRPTSLPAGIMAADTPGLPIEAYANSRVASAWLAPLGGRGVIEADGNAGELDWWTAGIAGGYEGPIDVASGSAYAGFGLGYLRSHGAVDARLSTMDADNFNIGVYGGWADGPWSVAGSLAYSASSVSTERRIVFGGIDRTAEADYWNHTIGFSVEAAYGFDLANGTKISPLFTLDAGWSGHGGFTETGAGALSLTGASESWARLDTGLGIAVAHTFVTESGNLILDGRVVWEHAFADVVPSQSLSFAGSPTAFEVRGPDAGRDRLRLGLGLSFEATEDLTIRAGYSGLFSGNQQSHGASVGLNVKF